MNSRKEHYSARETARNDETLRRPSSRCYRDLYDFPIPNDEALQSINSTLRSNPNGALT